MLRGFAAVAPEHPEALLVCAGWGADLERSRALAAGLGLGDRVRFLPHALSKTRLLRHYRAADVVLDQFVVGSYGTSALEAMSAGAPLLIHLEPERFAAVFDEFPPVGNCRTPDEIAGWLRRLFGDPGERERLGADGRRWVVEHHGDELVDRQLAVIEAALT
jgi:glycosyltransferase involved in cell wall biosynthesis